MAGWPSLTRNRCYDERPSRAVDGSLENANCRGQPISSDCRGWRGLEALPRIASRQRDSPTEHLMFRLAPLPGDSSFTERNGNSKESREKPRAKGARGVELLTIGNSQTADSDPTGAASRIRGTGPVLRLERQYDIAADFIVPPFRVTRQRQPIPSGTGHDPACRLRI